MASISVTHKEPTIASLAQLLQPAPDAPALAAFNVASLLDPGISAIGGLLFAAADSQNGDLDNDTIRGAGALLQLLGELSALVRQAESSRAFAQTEALQAKLDEWVEIPVFSGKTEDAHND